MWHAVDKGAAAGSVASSSSHDNILHVYVRELYVIVVVAAAAAWGNLIYDAVKLKTLMGIRCCCKAHNDHVLDVSSTLILD